MAVIKRPAVSPAGPVRCSCAGSRFSDREIVKLSRPTDQRGNSDSPATGANGVVLYQARISWARPLLSRQSFTIKLKEPGWGRNTARGWAEPRQANPPGA